MSDKEKELESTAEEATDETEVVASEDVEEATADQPEDVEAEAEEVAAEAEAEEAVAEAKPAKKTTRSRAKAKTEEPVESEPVVKERKKGFNPHKRTSPVYGPGKYAVIETGGKQYRVAVGDRLTIEKLEADAGSEVNFDRVLLVGGEGSTKIGTPVVDGANVTATIDEHGRGEKIVIFKYKAKKRYRRRTGHRQAQTRITITAISG